jgi:hypothetical protein
VRDHRVDVARDDPRPTKQGSDDTRLGRAKRLDEEGTLKAAVWRKSGEPLLASAMDG